MGSFRVAEGLCVCHDLIICAFISLWQPGREETKETPLKRRYKAAPHQHHPPPPSSPPPVPRFQIHWTTILFWALRAKHLLRFVSQNFSSPRGIYGSQGSNSCRYVVELASSRCLFPLPKAFRMQRTEGIEKTYLNSSSGGQPISQSSFSVFLLYNSEMQVFCLFVFSFFCSPPPF